VACCDETIQLFSDGRAGAIVDVMLDSSGVLCGCALLYLLFNKIKPYDSQILREIEYFRDLYGNLRRSVLILYDRTAFFGDDELRVTFDKNVRYRTERLNLSSDLNGTPLITDGKILMEIKIKGGMPIWLSKILSELKIYKTRFSKYGEAYKNILKQNLIFKEKVV